MLPMHMFPRVPFGYKIAAGSGTVYGFKCKGFLIDFDSSAGAVNHAQNLIVDNKLLFTHSQGKLHKSRCIVYEIASGKSHQQIVHSGLVSALGIQGFGVTDSGGRVIRESIESSQLSGGGVEQSAFNRSSEIAHILKIDRCGDTSVNHGRPGIGQLGEHDMYQTVTVLDNQCPGQGSRGSGSTGRIAP